MSVKVWLLDEEVWLRVEGWTGSVHYFEDEEYARRFLRRKGVDLGGVRFVKA